jgi:hypothetical protein
MGFRSGNAISENSIVFFEGGHDHDGVSSSLIDTGQYSIYDFTVGKIGSNQRQINQQRNFDNLKTVISNVIKTDVLGPSGVRLLPNSVQSVHIAAGAVTANELAANIVLVNNVIRSNNYVANTSGWVLYSNGAAEFGAASIRGTLTAGAVIINNNNYWYANGVFRVGSNSQFMSFNGNDLSVTGDVTTGKLSATGGQIAGWEITGDNLTSGGNYAGGMSLGPTAKPEEGGQPAYIVEAPASGVNSKSIMFSQGVAVERGNDYAEYLYSGVAISDGSISTTVFANFIGTPALGVDNSITIGEDGLYIDKDTISGGAGYFNAYDKGIRYPSIPGPGQKWPISFDYTNDGGIFYGVIDGNSGLQLSLEYTNISDRRLKNNVLPLSSELLNKIYSLNVYEYDFNNKNPLLHLRGQHRVGLIADEIRQVFPELVQFEPQDEMCVHRYVDYPNGMTVEEMNEYGDGWRYIFKEDGVYTIPIYEHISYKEFIPYLIGTIIDLNNRLKALEQ